MKAEFIIPGEPKGKGRPKFTRVGNYVRTYTPDDTVSYENLIKVEFKRQCGDVFFQKGTPLSMTVRAYYSVPKSASQKKARQMLAGELRPLKKVDSSNLLKAVEDALNTVAYHDDVQIVETVVSRFYAEVPRVEVVVEDISPADG